MCVCVCVYAYICVVLVFDLIFFLVTVIINYYCLFSVLVFVNLIKMVTSSFRT